MTTATTQQDCSYCFSWWGDVGRRLAVFFGVWIKDERVTYGWIAFLGVTQLGILATLAVALYAPNGGGVVDVHTESDRAVLRLFLVFSFLSFAVPPFTLYNNMSVPSQSIIRSVAENPRYKHIMSGWFSAVLLLGIGLNVVPAMDLSNLSVGLAVVTTTVMIPSTCSLVAVAAAYFSCIHATVRIIQKRTDWCERLLSDALETGNCTYQLALKVVRTHGASLSLIQRVSEGTSVALSMLVVGMIFSVSLNVGHLIAFVGTDESLAGSQAVNLAFNMTTLVSLLSFPAWLSYTGRHANDRLRSLCTASIGIGQQALSFAGSSVGPHPGTHLQNAHGLRSRSRSRTRSGSVSGSSSKSSSSTSSSSTSLVILPAAVNINITPGSSLGPEIHFPTTLYEIPPMALRPPLGDRAREEATALAHMAAHLSAEAPAYSMSGVKITVSLIAKIASSFVSIAVVVLRISNVSL